MVGSTGPLPDKSPRFSCCSPAGPRRRRETAASRRLPPLPAAGAAPASAFSIAVCATAAAAASVAALRPARPPICVNVRFRTGLQRVGGRACSALSVTASHQQAGSTGSTCITALAGATGSNGPQRLAVSPELWDIERQHLLLLLVVVQCALVEPPTVHPAGRGHAAAGRVRCRDCRQGHMA